MNIKENVALDLKELAELKIPGAQKTLDKVNKGDFDNDIEESSNMSVVDLTDMLMKLT